MAGTKDFVVEQGATFQKTIILRDASGAAIDISTYTPRGQVRKTHRSEEVLATFTFDTTYASSGKLTFTLTSTVTAALTAGETELDARSKYVYDLEIYKGTSPEIVKRLLGGNLYVDPNVTR